MRINSTIYSTIFYNKNTLLYIILLILIIEKLTIDALVPLLLFDRLHENEQLKK